MYYLINSQTNLSQDIIWSVLHLYLIIKSTKGEIQKQIISKLDVNNIDLDYAEKLINEKLSDIKC